MSVSRLIPWLRMTLGFDYPSKTQPFDEILYSRSGEEHSEGVFIESDRTRWERARVTEIVRFMYDSLSRTPISIRVEVSTTDGPKHMFLTSCDLHYLAPYVPAQSVDGLVGCVVPVMYSTVQRPDMSEIFDSIDKDPEPDSCLLSIENGELVANKSQSNVET